MRRSAWVEVDLEAVRHNIRELRRITRPESQIMAVVKANAYGHGALEVSRAALEAGAKWLAVATLDEAQEVRQGGIAAPVLILGDTLHERAKEVLRGGFRQAVFDCKLPEALSRAACSCGFPARVHIKVDTGMSRIGFSWEKEALEAAQRIRLLPGVEIEGVFTHLATADWADKEFAHEQLRRFIAVCGQIQKAIGKPFLRHAANSAAVIDLPESHFDIVRPGISIYGLYPSDEVDCSRIGLRPAMAVKARIIQIKDVPAGVSVSYGRTYYTPHATRIATLPIGYADGYPRLLSNRGEVLVRGKRAPVAGRVCMDQLMIDIGHITGVEVGSEVVLLGEQESQRITAEEWGKWAETINYEVVTRMGPRLERVFVNR